MNTVIKKSLYQQIILSIILLLSFGIGLLAPSNHSFASSICANGSSLTPAEFKNALDVGTITLSLAINGGNATFGIVNNTGCTAPLSLSSYKMYDGVLSHQVLFDRTSLTNISTGSLSVSVPSCMTQIDAWYGLAPSTLLQSNPYGSPYNDPWVLKWTYTSTPYCNDTTTPPPSVPTGTLTISPASCIISSGQSTCTISGATWTTSNTTSPSLVDRNVNTTLSTSAARSSPLVVWVAYPQTIFDLKNGTSILDTKTATATCASQTYWNGSVCASNSISNPTVSITANPSSVSYNGSSILTWSSTNATSCNASNGTNEWSGTKNTSGTFNTGALIYTTTYYITCTNSSESASDSITISVDSQQTQNPTVSISADNTNLSYGNSTTIRWYPNNATSCVASGGSNGWTGTRSNYSSTFNTGTLTYTTTYYITCTNSSGSASDSITVSVNNNNNYYNQQPTVTLYADNSNINYNGNATLRWYSSNADSCWGNGGTNGWSGSKGNSGSFNTGTLTYTTTYSITCTNGAGSVNDSVTVYVNNNNYYNNNSQTSVSISADRTNINYDEGTIIRWYPNNATSCVASGGSNGWTGTRSNYSDSFNTGPLTYTTTYTISCSNYNNYNNGYYNYNGGYDTKSITVNVGNQGQTTNSLTATTTAATQIQNTSVQLNSLILNSANNNPANAWFEWGTTINLGNTTTVTPVGALPSVIHVNSLSGLNPGTTYYFRAVAENSTWRNIGNILTFTTTGQQIIVSPPVRTTTTTTPTSVVLITSSVDRNQPIVPTIDNTRPHPGDEINYTVNYQNIGTGSINNLALQLPLPAEVDYVSSNPSNPTISNNNLVFNLGTLKANGQGTVTAKVRVRDNIAPGTNLNFPATLSYVDPSGQARSVNANTSAQVWSAPTNDNNGASSSSLGANVFGAGFLPQNLFGWLFLLILILLLVLLAKHIYNGNQSSGKKTTPVQH